MAPGGHLGLPCSHAYAHTTTAGDRALPGVLKGSDMAVFAVFKALGLKISVRAIAMCTERPGHSNGYYQRDASKKKDADEANTTTFVGALGDVYSCDGYGDEDRDQLLEACEAFGRAVDVTWLMSPSKALGELGLVYIAPVSTRQISRRRTSLGLLT